MLAPKVVHDIVTETRYQPVTEEHQAVTITVSPGDFARILTALRRVGRMKIGVTGSPRINDHALHDDNGRDLGTTFYARLVALEEELKTAAKSIGVDPGRDLSE